MEGSGGPESVCTGRKFPLRLPVRVRLRQGAAGLRSAGGTPRRHAHGVLSDGMRAVMC